MTTEKNYILPSEEPEVQTLLENIFVKGLDQKGLNAVYDDLSNNYDKILGDSNYYGPHSAAEAVAKFINMDERALKIILDIGAGTGMVAEELLKKGFKIFDALDPSPGMLEKAKRKGLYRNYICEAIGKDPLDLASDSYDVVTVVGSHTKNHIKSEALEEMVRLVKPNGLICIVARMEGLEKFDEYKDSFFPLCDQLEKDGKWQKVDRSVCPYWNTLEGLRLIYRVC